MSRDWIAEYAQSHRHPVNRACHTIGIPMIAISIPLAVAGAFIPVPASTRLWIAAVSLFVTGWIFQFVGHAFERKPPEFLRDPRFLFVGLRWWLAKLRGRA